MSKTQQAIERATEAEIGVLAPETEAEKVEHILRELAALTSIEYERLRKQKADQLGIRVEVLDSEVRSRRSRGQNESNGGGQKLTLNDPEPWDQPVELSSLLNELLATVRRYLAIAEAAAVSAVLWIVHTYVHDASDTSPLLNITSPTKRCGKSTLIELIATLVPRALTAANVTAASVFRVVDQCRPTLLVDEAETLGKDDQAALRAILNSGHRRATAVVTRCVGDDYEVRQFSTWCPKVLAAINTQPDTLQDRSIEIAMRRRAPGEHVYGWRFGLAITEHQPLRRQAARWARDNIKRLPAADPDIPAGLDDRAADNWRPLLAIADTAGGRWPELARDAAATLCARRDAEDESARTMLLSDIRDLFDARNTDRLPSEDVVKALTQMEIRPWPEWKAGKPITQRQLATLLKPFRIEPKVIRTLAKTPRRYLREQFDDVFSRYLPSQSATSATTKKHMRLGDLQSATKTARVADQEKDKSHYQNDVAEVADENKEEGKRI